MNELDRILLTLADGDWHSSAELGVSENLQRKLQTLRKRGYQIDMRVGSPTFEYRLLEPAKESA